MSTPPSRPTSSAPTSSAPTSSAADDAVEDPKAVRQRSLRLLGSLLRPVARPAWWTVAIVVLAQLAAVAGPALVAFGIDSALPALADDRDARPLVLAAGTYLVLAVGGGLLSAAVVGGAGGGRGGV